MQIKRTSLQDTKYEQFFHFWFVSHNFYIFWCTKLSFTFQNEFNYIAIASFHLANYCVIYKVIKIRPNRPSQPIQLWTESLSSPFWQQNHQCKKPSIKPENRLKTKKIGGSTGLNDVTFSFWYCKFHLFFLRLSFVLDLFPSCTNFFLLYV
jgi:hypothetical protein